MTHKRLLLALLVLLVSIPEVLSYVARNDNIGGFAEGNRGPFQWVVTALIVFMFVDGLRGSRTSFNFLASIELALGAGGLVGSFFVPNGPFQLAAASLAFIAAAIVTVLLRDEVAAERRRKGSRHAATV
jgi:hypothetical protein